jgi:hypothetical protein
MEVQILDAKRTAMIAVLASCALTRRNNCACIPALHALCMRFQGVVHSQCPLGLGLNSIAFFFFNAIDATINILLIILVFRMHPRGAIWLLKWGSAYNHVGV